MRVSAKRTKSRRGGALLAVLWLSVALATIALAVATRVRAETERSATLTEGLQAKYLAEGAIHRMVIANIRRVSLLSGARRVDFPNGYALVEIIPETARLNINRATPDELARLLMALGAPPQQAAETAAAIVDWRTPGSSAFDFYYLAQSPSFRARHASIEEIEELLFVKGMTPELFYGAYARDAQGRLTARGGFRDCVSPQGSVATFDAAGIEPALLLALGAPPAGVEQIRRLRATRPIGPNDVPMIQGLAGAAANRLRYGGYTIYTFRATAFLNSVPGVRRTMEATVKYFDRPVDMPFHITRWRETSTSYFANVGAPGWQQ